MDHWFQIELIFFLDSSTFHQLSFLHFHYLTCLLDHKTLGFQLQEFESKLEAKTPYPQIRCLLFYYQKWITFQWIHWSMSHPWVASSHYYSNGNHLQLYLWLLLVRQIITRYYNYFVPRYCRLALGNCFNARDFNLHLYLVSYFSTSSQSFIYT